MVVSDSIDKDSYIVKMAVASLKRPDDFSWFGGDEMFVTWGFAGVDLVTTGDDILNESNFYVISNDLTSRFPDDFNIVGVGHWVVGHLDRLRVRVLKAEGDVVIDNITEAFCELIDWHDSLMDYPVADDNDFSEREYNALLKLVSDELSYQWDDYIEFGEDYDEHASEIIYDVNQISYCSYDSPPGDDDITLYAFERGLCKFDECEFWEDWADRNKRVIVWNHHTNLGGKKQEIPGQLKLEV